MDQPRPELYLEDIAVGMRFKSSSVTVTEADIVAFGRQFDPQPFHTDPVAAKDSVFHGLAASGWHTAALTMRLFVESEFRIAGGLLGAGVEVLDWPRPVRPGDTLHVIVEVLSVRESKTRPTQGMVVVRSTTINQHGEVVQNLQPKMVVRKRTAGVQPTHTAAPEAAGDATSQADGAKDE